MDGGIWIALRDGILLNPYLPIVVTGYVAPSMVTSEGIFTSVTVSETHLTLASPSTISKASIFSRLGSDGSVGTSDHGGSVGFGSSPPHEVMHMSTDIIMTADNNLMKVLLIMINQVVSQLWHYKL